MYTVCTKVWGLYDFLMFLKEDSSARQSCIYLIKNTVKMWNFIKIENDCFLCEFSASLLQSSVSHDPSEIILICWFAVQRTFIIIIDVENSCAASFVCAS